MLATCKNWEFLEQDKTPILIFKFEPVLDKLEKNSETTGAHPSAARSEQWHSPCRPSSDCGHRHHSARSLRRHRPPPCAAIKDAERTRVSPFSPPSPPRHPALCRRRAYRQAPRRCQLSPPASQPNRPIPELWYSAAQLLDPAACHLDHRSFLPPPVCVCPDCCRRRELRSVSFWCPCSSNWSTTPPPCHNTFFPPISGAGLPESPTTVTAQ
jgi:hypothetical protein